jgi:hypothetical protein
MIITVGLVATAYMAGVQWLAQRLRYVRGDMVRALGSFLIPEPVRSGPVAVLMEFGGGVFFAAVYAYIFGFVKPVSVAYYIELGALIGLVHGFFVVYFLFFGFSALQPAEDLHYSAFHAAIVIVLTHILFGGMCGFGFGQGILHDGLWWFTAYAMVVAVGAGGLLAVALMPPERDAPPATRRRLPFRRSAIARGR